MKNPVINFLVLNISIGLVSILNLKFWNKFLKNILYNDDRIPISNKNDLYYFLNEKIALRFNVLVISLIVIWILAGASLLMEPYRNRSVLIMITFAHVLFWTFVCVLIHNVGGAGLMS